MIYAIVENGVVTNRVVAEEPASDNWVQSNSADIGDLYADGVFSTAPIAPEEIRARRDIMVKLKGFIWSGFYLRKNS